MVQPEVPLGGGDVTEGVVRVGTTVRRPTGPHSATVHEVLAHLECVGFTGAPRLLGIDDRGREILTYIDGEVAGRPWPAWIGDDERASSVARLVRRYDDAITTLGVAVDVRDDLDLPAARLSIDAPPTILGHCDITPENVVFRDETACALIDFDLVRPCTREFEVCNLLLWWAPLMPVDDREPAVRPLDAFARSRLLVDAYGRDALDVAALLPLAINIADRSWHAMRWRAEHLGGGWQRMWDDGVGDRIKRRQVWLRSNESALSDALTVE